MVATVTRLKAAATTVHYFEADGYYARNDPKRHRASGWYVKAAATLGLRGPVKPKRFEDILAGYVPGTGIRLGCLRDGEHQHRPGMDITFSAPKSVSLEALIYAAPRTGARVVKAHDEAVRATPGFIETELLQTRSYDPATGRRPRVEADGMTAATFRHLASRNLDPQLLTHAVVANMTRGLRTALGGALLMDLALADRIDTDLDGLFVVDPAPIGEPVLDRALASIVDDGGRRPIDRWVVVFAEDYESVRSILIEKLAARDRAARARRRVAGAGTHHCRDDGGRRLKDVRQRLAGVLLNDEVPGPRDMMIVSLADACTLWPGLLEESARIRLAPRIAQIARMDLIGQAVARAILSGDGVQAGEGGRCVSAR